MNKNTADYNRWLSRPGNKEKRRDYMREYMRRYRSVSPEQRARLKNRGVVDGGRRGQVHTGETEW